MSEWKEDANERRDFRATKAGPESVGGPKRHKDTKRWCRGKNGLEHDLVFRRDHWWGLCFCKATCQRCGKTRYIHSTEGDK